MPPEQRGIVPSEVLPATVIVCSVFNTAQMYKGAEQDDTVVHDVEPVKSLE